MSNIRKNAVYNIVLSVSQVLTPLLIFPYVSRVLGPTGMGDIGFVDSCLQFVVLVAALGIPIYGVREIAKTKDDVEKRSKLFSELLFIHVLATLLLSVLYLGVFTYFPKFSALRSLFMISLGMLYMQAFMVEWLFQGVEDFPFITKRALVIRLLSVLLIFMLVKKTGDTLLYYGIMFLTGTLNMMVNLVYARRYVHIRYRNLNLTQHLKPLFYIFSFGIVVSVYTVLDTTILGLIKDSEEVGYYSVVVRVTKLVIAVLTAFVLVVIPRLSVAFKQQEKEEINTLLHKSFSYIVLIGIPASAGLVIYAPELIALFAGEQFSPSVWTLRIMAPSIIVIGLSHVFGMLILNPSGNEKLFFKAALIGMFVSLAANFTLIPQIGQYGAAIANIVTELVVLLLLMVFSFKVLTFRPAWKQIFQAVVSSLLFVPISYLLRSIGLDLFVVFISGVIVSTCVYFAVQHWVWKNQFVGDFGRTILVKIGVKMERGEDE